MIKALWNKFAMPCKEATYLSSRKLDGSISLIQRIRLSAHYLTCHVCEVYARQIQAVQDLLKSLGAAPNRADETRLTEEQRKQIKASLEKEYHS